jgi:hypothetical protein
MKSKTSKRHSILCKPFIAVARLFNHHDKLNKTLTTVSFILGVGFLLKFLGKHISS